jgi:hypothetical protein
LNCIIYGLITGLRAVLKAIGVSLCPKELNVPA